MPTPNADAHLCAADQNLRVRLSVGLSKTRATLTAPLMRLFQRASIDGALLEELETTLLMADCGVTATQGLLQELNSIIRQERLTDAAVLRVKLVERFTALLKPLEQPLTISNPRPFIILCAGVNGAGKTTTLGKLAHYFQTAGLRVMLAAGDTFRAAAREQLQEWGRRNEIAVIAQNADQGGDPAAVIFDAIGAARARGMDVLLADTAGRLPTQLHLMEELAKIKRVIQKAEPAAPHEVLLVLDANVGQNAVNQVRAFDRALGVTGLILTKLDGTAKGGVLAALARQCPKPVRFIGIGEGIEDLQTFAAGDFAEALFDAKSLEGQINPEFLA